MKCTIEKIEPKTCKTCGFTTNDALIMVCPRCMSSLPGPTSCSGGCAGCSLRR